MTEQIKCEKYLNLFDGLSGDTNGSFIFKESLNGFIEEGVLDSLSDIMNTVLDVKDNDFSLEFDPTLVRGMGYYTGTIFEVSMEGILRFGSRWRKI